LEGEDHEDQGIELLNTEAVLLVLIDPLSLLLVPLLISLFHCIISIPTSLLPLISIRFAVAVAVAIRRPESKRIFTGPKSSFVTASAVSPKDRPIKVRESEEEGEREAEKFEEQNEDDDEEEEASTKKEGRDEEREEKEEKGCKGEEKESTEIDFNSGWRRRRR